MLQKRIKRLTLWAKRITNLFTWFTNIYFITKKRKEYDLFTRSRTHVCCEKRS